VLVAIDVEGGCAGDAGGYAAVEVCLDAASVFPFFECVLEMVGTETEPGGKLEEVGVFQVGLVFEEEIVHLPELAVGGCELGCFCGVLGVGVHLEREVAEDEAELVAEVLLQLLHDRVRVAAGWTLVVAVLDEGPWGVGLALRVIVTGNRGGEFAHEDWMPWSRKLFGLFAGAAFAEADELVEGVDGGATS